MLKAAIKQSEADQIRHRIIPADAVAAMAQKIDDIKDDIQDVLAEEKEEKAVRRLWRRPWLRG
jgi:ATP-dependent RNA helicase DDX27